jgi:uncharacterized membrane protein YidH (DUF202 family)
VTSEPPLPPDERDFGDPTRRTYLAQERTTLAWWRTAFAAIAVSLAVGRLLPAVAKLPRAPFIVLGVGYGVLALGLLAVGWARQRSATRAIDRGGFTTLPNTVVVVLTVYMMVLGLATMSALFWGG